MSTEQFLARVIGPGNYACIAWKSPDYQMAQRFFPRDKLADAVKETLYWSGRGADTYFGLAGFKDAEAGVDKKNRPILRGKRTQDNAQAMRGLWVDLDACQRPGRRQGPGACVCRPPSAAVAWLTNFVQTSGVPGPNMLVNSGHGYHVYWLLEQSLAKHEWQPYAEAFKNMLIASGYIGDLQRVADAASVLPARRAPSTRRAAAGHPLRWCSRRPIYPTRCCLTRSIPM